MLRYICSVARQLFPLSLEFFPLAVYALSFASKTLVNLQSLILLVLLSYTSFILAGEDPLLKLKEIAVSDPQLMTHMRPRLYFHLPLVPPWKQQCDLVGLKNA